MMEVDFQKRLNICSDLRNKIYEFLNGTSTQISQDELNFLYALLCKEEINLKDALENIDKYI